MNDPLNKLESELAALRPRDLPPQLVDRIAAQLNERPRRMSFADRCLTSFMGTGALAACIIVALLIVQMQPDHSPSVPPPAQASVAAPSSVAEFQQAIAQSSSASFELFR